MTGVKPESRRARQAAETRRDILNAARKLFAQKGYAATSVAEIAAAAGASVQTIYDSVGSKAELVSALNDLIDEEGGVAKAHAAIFRAAGKTYAPELRFFFAFGARRHNKLVFTSPADGVNVIPFAVNIDSALAFVARVYIDQIIGVDSRYCGNDRQMPAVRRPNGPGCTDRLMRHLADPGAVETPMTAATVAEARALAALHAARTRLRP